jgi:hypothetical protein
MNNTLNGEVAKTSDRPVPTMDDLRSAPRFAVMIRAAKMLTAKGEFLCIIRDASESGISLKLFHEMPHCGEIIVELQNGDRFAVEPVWQEGDRAGFRFVEPVDIGRIVELSDRYSKRGVRVSLGAPVEIDAGGHEFTAQLHDISPQGAKIATTHKLAIDQRVSLSGGGLRPTRACVRWRREGFVGLVFEDVFQFSEMAGIVYLLQCPPAQKRAAKVAGLTSL